MHKNKAGTGSSGRALAATAICVFFSGFLTVCAAASAPDAVTPDGGRYYGQLADGKLQGQGKMEWENGSTYEGGFEKGLFSGNGKYQLHLGYLYEGEFKDGMRSGQGRAVNPRGTVYVGHFANNEFNGFGKLTSRTEEYIGQFKQGAYAGKGEVKYSNGHASYKGEFADGQYQGKGRYEVKGEEFYEGEFDKGEFAGYGIFQRKNGSRYTGAFKKWLPDGGGRLTDASGNVYEGVFSGGRLVGQGRYIGKDGSSYQGGFKNWKYHGQGIYRNAKGDQYTGNFAYGLYEGEGTLVYATPQKDGRTKDSGNWSEGVLENAAAEAQAQQNIETALYQQRALLDKALAAVAPREPGKVNLYLLAVAGDGSQEVFHRETDFVQQQFDRDFGTRGRSIVLVNSRNTVSQQPMATVTSIRESLNAIAGRMDKEKDILFLYLTSHGSRDHQLMLAQNGMELRNLKATELGKMLAESGIRWKVVVVSACYAGGFINPLKDERTMVIAAARPDRTSFGCSDDNDFTYFGRAFFQKSLPGSASFSAAFDKAKTLVATWENDDIKSAGKDSEVLHSEPQIYHTSLIDQYLKTWQAQPKTASAQR
ncbi:C13 family peptidase [Collimonas fungivorans]|uniref:C13 family peptidase n=1 Tax=Collimonas fungivorans TaxID=158899 RepID=UPI003FA3D037